jgi:macrolide transport system ATP-binding/permease protein
MRLRALLRFDAVDAELHDEMRAHLERLVAEHVARGMAPEAARAAAHREFGPMTQLMEESRDARGTMWIVAAAQDLRYGLRLLRRTPGFAAEDACSRFTGRLAPAPTPTRAPPPSYN